MPRLRLGDDDRVEGEDLAAARHRWYWSTAHRPGHGPPDGWGDTRHAPPELLAQARTEPPAATHAPCCWCPRCVTAARAFGARPMDVLACRAAHADGVHR